VLALRKEVTLAGCGIGLPLPQLPRPLDLAFVDDARRLGLGLGQQCHLAQRYRLPNRLALSSV
jgi:hypothetical protein